MPITLSDEQFKTVNEALSLALYEFQTTDGLDVDDDPNNHDAFRLDFSQVIKITIDAISLLDTLAYNHNKDCS